MVTWEASCNEIHQQLQSSAILSHLHAVPLARNILRIHCLKNRSAQQIMARRSHIKYSLDFHDKYGNSVLASRTTFFVVWIFRNTQIGIEWNLSSVDRVPTKE
ncbi:unnamed protein product [Nyctereutes procyonoides]|uniref:(raccoon dog) hypothetical protein n=1 Tax=Nyctereutes procyonoides TaxID=34880 RepID=A0A811ZEK1_NYCPR|nr:unnamed protein product [Nyctereutes procyonoides]